MVHVGPGLDVALVRVVDGGGPGVGAAQDEDEPVETHRRCVLVVWRSSGREREKEGWRETCFSLEAAELLSCRQKKSPIFTIIAFLFFIFFAFQ